MNWIVRLKNKNFWLSFIPTVLLLIQAVALVFGFELDFGDLGNQLKEIINLAFIVLALLGVVNDPTTKGLGDSEQALTYKTPKED